MKKLIALLLTAVICFSLAACGSSQETEKNDTEVTQEETTDKSLETESETVEETTESEETEKVEEVIVDNTPVIAVGESATTDKCEFTVDYVNITRDVMPPQPGDWYSHYEAEAGKVYVDFCVAYKNTDTANVDADKTLSGKLIYNGKYEYSGFSMIEEESRSDFTYSNITSIAPLTTEYVHYLFSVPEEVETSGAEIVLKMTIGGAEYKIVVREGNGETTSNTETELGKTSGEVVLGEVVVTKNSEFNIDYSDITKDVMPPQPGDWYSHYEAEAGKVYVDVCFAYKNTSGSNVGADDVISAKLKYAGKYDYTGFSMIEEESRSDFTYSNITSIAPLSTEYVHFLFAVPEEVGTSSESVEITFTIDGNTYTYKVR